MSSRHASPFVRIALAGSLAALLSGVAMAQGATPMAAASDVDSGVRPGDDFYAYANGVWLRTTPLPEGRARYDTTAQLRALSSERVQMLVDGAVAAARAGKSDRVGSWYVSWMNTAGIEARGLQPLSGDLAAIAAIADRKALSARLGGSLTLDDGSNTQTAGLFGVWIHPDFHDPDHYVPHLVQGGLGLFDRETYLDEGAEAVAAREAYRAHVAAVLTLAGFDLADARATRVLALETAIARAQAPRADTDDVFKTDNTWRRADFGAKAPGMDWDAWFGAADLGRQDRFVVWQPSALKGIAALVGDQPIETWKDYLAFHLLEHYAAVLPKAFGGQQPDRAAQAIASTTTALGEDIGRRYVARWFPPSAKAAATEMAENLRTAMAARVARQAWRSPAARDMALAKVAAVRIGLGYPDRWIDYAGLDIRNDDALGNLRRAEAFAYRRELAKLERPVDPGEWSGLLPQQAGAIINFSPNAMQFSAGILQPPFFDPTGDAAANYGSAGAGMAHEISHSIDELGSLYDARGRLLRWWTPEELARYRAAAAPLLAQLDAYCPRPGLCVKGEQVLGEGIGDLAGLLVAYDAYHLSLKGKPDAIRDGLTGDQRFFLAFARRWRRVQTDAALAQQIASDTHAPGEYRTDTVRNLEAWRRAFGVQPGDKLYLPPEARTGVW